MKVNNSCNYKSAYQLANLEPKDHPIFEANEELFYDFGPISRVSGFGTKRQSGNNYGNGIG
jgi:hypothetical protein